MIPIHELTLTGIHPKGLTGKKRHHRHHLVDVKRVLFVIVPGKEEMK